MVKIPEGLLTKLKEGIANRHIDDGMACLREHEHLLSHLDPQEKNAGVLVGYLAQWVDIGFDRPPRVRELLDRFPRQVRPTLALKDYVNLRMAEGMLAMNSEDSREALANFDVALALGEDLGDQDILAVANFWKARSLRKAGEYDSALTYTLKARTLALELDYPKMAAVMRVLESWLLFQKGKSSSAEYILREAESILCGTDDFVTLGNIHSSDGRIARREGHYDKAIHHFTLAIREYRKRDSQHPHLARTLANIALVKRLVSLHLGKKIDVLMKRRRKAAARGQKMTRAAIGARSGLEQLRQQAFAHLEEAAAIYQHHGSNHGVSTIHLVYGYLYLDDGDFDRAEESARAGFELAQHKSDYIIMSRVRLLQCMVENAKVEDGIGEQTDPEIHAKQALACAHDAIGFAKQTQNRRVLANAYVWEGLTYCNGFLRDFDAARKSHESASILIKSDRGGQLSEDLHTLQAMLLPRVKVDETLRAWSQGSVGNKSFQQILEEFTELIIPKVWESEGRKVSRVAERLSISPKKVRRILDVVGARKALARRR